MPRSATTAESCPRPPGSTQPLPRLRGAACLWLGDHRGFISDNCVSWPTVRWGRGQENRTGARSAAKALAEPGRFPAAPRGRGPAQPALTTWQRAKLFHSVARHILHRGVLLLTLLLASPRAVCLAAGSTFISQQPHTLIIIIVIKDHISQPAVQTVKERQLAGKMKTIIFCANCKGGGEKKKKVTC